MKCMPYILIITIILLLISIKLVKEDASSNENLLNKVNAVENQWIDYKGTVEFDNNMMKSQFIPYNSNQDYLVNNDAYVSYYKGEDFIITELHDAETELNSVDEADGIILSFNKKNKNGIKLINKD